MSALPKRDPKGKYPSTYFGYECHCIEWAVERDDVAAMRECIAQGFVSMDSRCIDNAPLLTYARRKGAARVAALLAEAGYPAALPIRYGPLLGSKVNA